MAGRRAVAEVIAARRKVPVVEGAEDRDRKPLRSMRRGWSMLEVVGDWWAGVRSRVRASRLMQEKLLELAEGSGRPRAVVDDEAGWSLVGTGRKEPVELDRVSLRTRARTLAMHNAHARNVLRLLEVYVVGPGLGVKSTKRIATDRDESLETAVDAVWDEFLITNASHFSYREYARRAWRDGECFLRLYPDGRGGTTVRFVDPEEIGDPNGADEQQGVISAADDVETVVEYHRIDPVTRRLREAVEPEFMLHTRLGVDSNQKRGLTVLAPVLRELEQFDTWMETELVARRMQASVVLWRRVNGSPSQVAALADAGMGEVTTDPMSGSRRERLKAGTIVTTSQGTELKFLQPDTNFGDSMPLGRMVLLCVAAGQGLPEFMVTADASNGNYASTMVAEGPAVKLFEAEQQFFVGEFTRLWRKVMVEAARGGVLPADVLARVKPTWTTPGLINRDRVKERLADVRLVEAGVLSRAEVARREGVEWGRMEGEVKSQK